MGKIYESIDDYEEAYEKEFRNTVEEIAYYQGDIERTTIDGEWEESELKEDAYSEAKKILLGENGRTGWIENYRGRLLRDDNLIKPEYLSEEVASNYDLIEIYNKAYDLHRNDKPMKFVIHYFDEAIREKIKEILRENLVTK